MSKPGVTHPVGYSGASGPNHLVHRRFNNGTWLVCLFVYLRGCWRRYCRCATCTHNACRDSFTRKITSPNPTSPHGDRRFRSGFNPENIATYPLPRASDPTPLEVARVYIAFAKNSQSQHESLQQCTGSTPRLPLSKTFS